MEQSQRAKHIFDYWAYSGVAEHTGKSHFSTVQHMLRSVSAKKPLAVLDACCGNGWAAKLIQNYPWCQSVIGIDVSELMIQTARQQIFSAKEQYICTDLLSWQTTHRFDLVLSMESLYYLQSPRAGIHKIFQLLKPGGLFLFGTACYLENEASHHWGDYVGVPITLLSSKQWRNFFIDSGFSVITSSVITQKDSDEQWKNTQGTLFIAARKSA